MAPNVTVSANYVFVRGENLPRTINSNLLPPVVLTLQNAATLGIADPTPQQIGRDVFGPGRLNPAFNDIFLLTNSASSTYHGMTVSATRRLANDWELMASYTLSKTLDDASDFDELPQNPYDLSAERARSSQYQAQRFALHALWNLPIPGEIELAPIVTLGTGRPINPLVGLDANLSQSFPSSARPLGFGRNSLLTPGTANVDLGVVKTIKFGGRRHLDLIAQFFNLFNHDAATAINPFFGTGVVAIPTFRQPIQTVIPRQIQFGANFEY
jgi:hypothetical protein